MPPAALAALFLLGRLDADGVGRLDEEIGADRRHGDRNADEQPEPPRKVGKRDGHVHAPEACDQRGHADDDRDDRQKLHDHVDVVGDDGGKGVHRARENVAVDGTHLHCLTGLDDDVVKKILIFLVSRDRGEATEAVVDIEVCRQRRGEVDEGILDAQHLNEFLVLHRTVQLRLHAP